MTSENPKKKKSFITVLIETIIMDIIISILFFMSDAPSSFFKTRKYSTRIKACYSNLRVIQGAIEMYNMDNSIFITEYNKESEKKLLEGKYLKEKPVKPETSCSYTSKDDLSKDGVLFCEYHGSLFSDITPSRSYEEYKKESQRNLYLAYLVALAICLGPGLIYMLISL